MLWLLNNFTSCSLLRNTCLPHCAIYIIYMHIRMVSLFRDLVDIPRQADLVHLHGELEEVVQTFALCLCLGRSVAPDIADQISTVFSTR
jgi:hypothetical protein